MTPNNKKLVVIVGLSRQEANQLFNEGLQRGVVCYNAENLNSADAILAGHGGELDALVVTRDACCSEDHYTLEQVIQQVRDLRRDVPVVVTSEDRGLESRILQVVTPVHVCNKKSILDLVNRL